MGARKDRSHRYRTTVTWTGSDGRGTLEYGSYGRSYTVRVDGKPVLSGSAHPAFRGDPAVHDPEDLFLAAVTGCHMLSYLALCARQGLAVLAYEDRATGVLALDPGGGGRFREIELNPCVTIADGADEAAALALHRTAHARCFIANSCNAPIACHPTIRIVAPAGAARSGGDA